MSHLCQTPSKYEESFMMYKHDQISQPNHRKESAMIKLTMEHVNAICHAELLMDACQLVQGAHKLRAKIEQDMLKLAELKLYIIQMLANPPVLFDEKKES